MGTLETLGSSVADNHYSALLLDLAFFPLGQLGRRDIHGAHDMPGDEPDCVANIHDRGAVVDHANSFGDSDLESSTCPETKLERDYGKQHHERPGDEIWVCSSKLEELVHEVRSGWRRIITMA